MSVCGDCVNVWVCFDKNADICFNLCMCQRTEWGASPVGDLLLAAGQVSCVPASLYSGTAEHGLTQQHACMLSPDSINSLLFLSSLFVHAHHS